MLCLWAIDAGVTGVIAIELNVAFDTDTLNELVILSTCTVIVLVPGATPVTTPLEFTVADAGFEELKVALDVRSSVDPSENVPMTEI